MKQNVLVFSMLIYFSFSCREQIANNSQVQSQAAPIHSDSACCKKSLAGSYSQTNSYHVYPSQPLDISCAANGATISVSVQALDVPNRFNVYDASNTLVAQSEWLGNAKFPGPWGQKLSGTGSVIFSFKKNASVYNLKVETLTPPSSTYSPTTDHWSTTIMCLN